MRSRSTAALLVAALAGVAMPSVIAPTNVAAASVTIPKLTDLTVAKIVSTVAKEIPKIDKIKPEVEGIKIAVISSGINTAILPEVLRNRVASAGPDPEGLGSYAASVLLQAADVKLTNLPVYNKGRVDEGKLRSSLDWAIANKPDAVLLAFPPHEVLDPVGATIEAKQQAQLNDVIASFPLTSTKSKNAAFGIPMDPAQRSKALADATPGERKIAEAFVARVNAWQALRDKIATLTKLGIPVVIPAGDLGPRISTIYGIAGLPEVITVGASDGNSVASTSSRGPGLGGVVKPDLVAPAGLIGLMPEASTLAKHLGELRLLDAALEPAWDAGSPLTKARARLSSTIASASVVSALTGALRHSGTGDVNIQRGALMAASVPTSGVPVWAQGAGVLLGAPTQAFVKSRSLALSNGNLGIEPDAASWSTLVPFSQGVAGAGIKLTDVATLVPGGNAKERSTTSAEVDAASVGVSNSGVRIGAPAGDQSIQGGVFCGYSEVSIPGTGSTVDPTVTIDGVPTGVEQVPTCLIKGSNVDGFSFFIHDMPAENQTFALLPGVPEELGLAKMALHILPVNPLDTKIYMRVSGEDGYTHFPNIIPGFYDVKLFSDFGAPVTQTLKNATTGAAVVQNHDIGNTVSYQSFDAWFLGATGWTEQDLRNTFGDENVTLDKPHAAYFVKTPVKTIRVVLGKFKKQPGPTVSSRVIDFVAGNDLAYSVSPVKMLQNLAGIQQLPVVKDAMNWAFTPGDDGVTGMLNPLLTGQTIDTSMAGVAHYPFSLTTPNYVMDMSLDFGYKLSNAAVIAVVMAGDEIQSGVVTPQGSIRTPTVGPFSPIGANGVAIGQATGLAHFDFKLHPKGDDEGDLFLIFVPSSQVGALTAPLVSAEIDGLRMAYETWQRTEWPATSTEHGQGHTFTFDPNYSARQMNDDVCREISSGGLASTVCEDWQVQVHSPGDDSSTVGIVDAEGNAILDALVSSGGEFADPRRGVIDQSLVNVSFGFANLPIDGAVSLATPFRVNGRFWEQLIFPAAILSAKPGTILVQILDNARGRSSSFAGHLTGGAPVAPYVPFVNQATVVDPLDGVGDGLEGIPPLPKL